MRNYVFAFTAIATAISGIPTASADPAGTAFCSQIKSPIANKIYFTRPDGVIAQLQNNAEVNRGQTELYFYRYRANEAANRAGAIAVKVAYMKSSNPAQEQVTLFNNKKTVLQRCKVANVERYERFHGESEEPNACIKTSFHQGYRSGDPPFDTLKPNTRRREFVLGASGQDTRGISAVILQIAQFPFNYRFENIFKESPNPTAPRSALMSYRSQIYNYSGEAAAGSCIRFVLFSNIDDVAANLIVTDLLESEQNEFVRAGVQNIRFVGN